MKSIDGETQCDRKAAANRDSIGQKNAPVKKQYREASKN